MSTTADHGGGHAQPMFELPAADDAGPHDEHCISGDSFKNADEDATVTLSPDESDRLLENARQEGVRQVALEFQQAWHSVILPALETTRAILEDSSENSPMPSCRQRAEFALSVLSRVHGIYHGIQQKYVDRFGSLLAETESNMGAAEVMATVAKTLESITEFTVKQKLP